MRSSLAASVLTARRNGTPARVIGLPLKHGTPPWDTDVLRRLSGQEYRVCGHRVHRGLHGLRLVHLQLAVVSLQAVLGRLHHDDDVRAARCAHAIHSRHSLHQRCCSPRPAAPPCTPQLEPLRGLLGPQVRQPLLLGLHRTRTGGHVGDWRCGGLHFRKPCYHVPHRGHGHLFRAQLSGTGAPKWANVGVAGPSLTRTEFEVRARQAIDGIVAVLTAAAGIDRKRELGCVDWDTLEAPAAPVGLRRWHYTARVAVPPAAGGLRCSARRPCPLRPWASSSSSIPPSPTPPSPPPPLPASPRSSPPPGRRPALHLPHDQGLRAAHLRHYSDRPAAHLHLQLDCAVRPPDQLDGGGRHRGGLLRNLVANLPLVAARVGEARRPSHVLLSGEAFSEAGPVRNVSHPASGASDSSWEPVALVARNVLRRASSPRSLSAPTRRLKRKLHVRSGGGRRRRRI